MESNHRYKRNITGGTHDKRLTTSYPINNEYHLRRPLEITNSLATKATKMTSVKRIGDQYETRRISKDSNKG